jgi:hypothetical protein
MKNKQILILPFLMLFTFAAACSPVYPFTEVPGTVNSTSTAPAEEVVSAVPETDGDEASEPLSNEEAEPPEEVNSMPTSIPYEGEVPSEIMDAIIDDLRSEIEFERADLIITRAERVIWNDGSLGCPEPGMAYTQALVDGFWIVFEIEGVVYDYRANLGGYFIRCDGDGLIGQPPTG